MQKKASIPWNWVTGGCEGLDVANPVRMLGQQGLPAAEPSLALLSFLLI